MIPDERIPQAIGRYQVLQVLGAGAMGNVLLAEDPRIKRKVAIKVVRLEALRHPEGPGGVPGPVPA